METQVLIENNLQYSNEMRDPHLGRSLGEVLQREGREIWQNIKGC
jgi:hypothetical protein